MNWHDIFEYRNGHLYRKKAYHKSHIGKEQQGHINRNGYCAIRIANKEYMRYRIVWEMFNGPIPPGMHIDHVNRDRADDRLDNLRLVTPRQNTQNRSDQSKYGCGVYLIAASKKGSHRKQTYAAEIRIGSCESKAAKRIYLGSFSTPEEAQAAYQEAAAKNRRGLLPLV